MGIRGGEMGSRDEMKLFMLRTDSQQLVGKGIKVKKEAPHHFHFHSQDFICRFCTKKKLSTMRLTRTESLITFTAS